MNSISTVKSLLWIAYLILIVLLGGLVGAYYVSKVFFSGMVVTIALITFFGFLILGSNKEQHERLTEKNMRLAIAASLVITYMVIVGTTIFFGEHIGKMPDLASTALTSFTSIVGVVVAFYFGGSVYSETQAKKLGKKDDQINPK